VASWREIWQRFPWTAWKQEEHRLRVFEPRRAEVVGSWRKLRNEELLNLCASPSINKMVKSRRIRWTRMKQEWGRRGTDIGYWWESPKERD
jgi:hypothetical protein